MRKNWKLTDVVNAACSLMQLRVGAIADTKTVLSSYLFDNVTYLDMVYDSIDDDRLSNPDYWHVLYDKFGQITLSELMDMRLPIVIGDDSGASAFDYVKSIDEDTYNVIKLAQDKKDIATRYIYIAQEKDSVSKWGKLQYFDKVSENLNESQIKQRADNLLMMKNRETEDLSLRNVLGDTRVVGGSGLKVEIASAGIDAWGVVDSVTHHFRKDLHTMDLKILFGRGAV